MPIIQQFYPIAYLDGPGDVTRRSYIDTSLEMYNVDQSHYRYIVQLVQNFDYKPPTRNVRSILLQDTINSDSTGYNFEWTYYNGWQSPSYTIYKAQVDTSSPTLAWEAFGRGPDSNYLREEWLIPDPLNETNSGLYVFKVEAIDAVNTANNFISQSNWVYIDIPYNVPVPPLAPDSAVVPNVFSPNGDNINDIFYVSGVKGYTDLTIEVFNRWGKRVFSAAENRTGMERDIPQGLYWDGTDMNSGQTLGDGVYYYIVTLNDNVTGTSKNLQGQVYITKN